MAPSMKALRIRRLGLVPYGQALGIMDDLVERRLAGEPDTLLLVRHPAVITLGRKRGARGSLRQPVSVPVVEVPRGGDATFHGPGQMVAYPIVRLEGADRDLHRFLRMLEEACLEALVPLGVPARRDPGRTGIWTGTDKIASIGIAVRRWVTYHGLALNLRPEPGFEVMDPCGLVGVRMTSVEEWTGSPVSHRAAEDAFIPAFARAFGYNEVDEPETQPCPSS